MGLLTDRYLRVKGVDDGSMFAIGDCATIEQVKLVDRLQNIFEEADTQRRGALDLQQFRALVERKINEFPQVRKTIRFIHRNQFDSLLVGNDLEKS